MEKPYKTNRSPSQCYNCQSNGHIKAYCSHPPQLQGRAFVWKVTKDRKLPVECALYDEGHTNSPKGCSTHKNYLNLISLHSFPISAHPAQLRCLKSSTQKLSYTDVTHDQPPTEQLNDASEFLNYFKSIITPLIILLMEVLSKRSFTSLHFICSLIL